MKEMILEGKYGWSDKEYYSDITRILDNQCGLQMIPKHFKNYIYDTRDIWDKHTLAIRIPGRTVGEINIDDNGVITNVEIDRVLIGEDNWYKENVNEELKRFLGMKVVFPEMGTENKNIQV